MFTYPLTRKGLGMAQTKTNTRKDPKTITTKPRGNGLLEKGEKDKAEKKLGRVLGH